MGGAANAMCAQPFYRLLARQPAALAAVVAALLASGGHRSPRSTAAVGHYALQLIVSFIRPPALAEAQVGLSLAWFLSWSVRKVLWKVAGAMHEPQWGTAHCYSSSHSCGCRRSSRRRWVLNTNATRDRIPDS